MTETPTHNDTTLIAHAFLFLTQVAGLTYQWFREGRRHEWQKEQFARINREIKNGHS